MNGMIEQNTLIKQVEAKLEEQMLPTVRADYMKIVVAGMKLALHGGNGGLLSAIAKSKDPLSTIVQGAVALVVVLRKQSRGTMPPKAIPPATFSLILHALDYADRTGVLKVDAGVIDQAAQLFAHTLLASAGVSPAALQNLAVQVHGVMQDPAKMARVRELQGQDPAAAAPATAPAAAAAQPGA